jgi:hypothetical protein
MKKIMTYEIELEIGIKVELIYQIKFTFIKSMND